MNVPVIAFFNNKGGVGKTSLVYHLAHMYAELGKKVLAADLDPQANLTAAFVDEERLDGMWSDGAAATIYSCVEPLVRGTGDISEPRLEEMEERLALIAGDLALSGFEDQLSKSWPECSDGDERAFRVISSFWRIIQQGAKAHKAELVLADLGPNLGAINRAALIAADYVAIPLSPDLFSLKGLQNLGPTLIRWRKQWKERLQRNPDESLPLPQGKMQPVGYIVMQHSERLDRPVKAYQKWAGRIPETYQNSVLDIKKSAGRKKTIDRDSNCLGIIKHYRSLMPMAQEARKPIFHLKPADGALGSHFTAAQDAYLHFKKLADRILTAIKEN